MIYTRTDSEQHHKTVQIFLKLLDNKKMYLKEVEQAFCNSCNQFLPDRFVEGECPDCGEFARGDQCDNCSNILDPLELGNKNVSYVVILQKLKLQNIFIIN